MGSKFHGVFSLIIFYSAMVVALIALWVRSIPLAILYAVVIGLSSFSILYAYCCKCTVRSKNCSHVFPGKLTRLLPHRKQGTYTFMDISGTVTGLAAIVFFPQYWLIQNKVVLIIFWALVILAVSEILTKVCRQCENTRCIMCPSKFSYPGANNERGARMKSNFTLKSILPVFLILTASVIVFHQKEARSDSPFMTNSLLKAYRAYFMAIDFNAEMRRLPYAVKQKLAPYFSGLNLDRVWYGESRHLGIPNTAMTDCNRIYFPSGSGIIDIIEKGHLFEKKHNDDLHWLLHELTHSQQCQALGGRDEYAELWFGELTTTTLTQLLMDWRSVNTSMLHDVMPMEKDAEQNAIKILPTIASK